MKKNSHPLSNISKRNRSASFNPAGNPEADLSLLELEKRRNLFAQRENSRLAGISGRAAIIFALLMILFKLLLILSPQTAEIMSAHGFRALTLEMLTITAILPLLASLAVILLDKPSAVFSLGEKIRVLPALLAFLAGFPLAFACLTADHLLANFLTADIALKGIGWGLLNQGISLFSSSWIQIFLTVLSACLITAVSHGLFIEGLILPGLQIDKDYFTSIFFTASFAALAHQQLRAIPVLFVFYFFAGKVRLDSGSLFVSAISLFSIYLGWLFYPLLYQQAADIILGELPSNTNQMLSLTLPVMFLSFLLFLPLVFYFSSYKSRRNAEESRQGEYLAAREENSKDNKSKQDYLFQLALALLLAILLLEKYLPAL